MKKFLYIIFVLFLASSLKAQELDVIVTVNYEQLQTVAKEKLEKFQQQIQDYFNSNKFTNGNWEGEKIKCTFNVFFTSSDNSTRFSGQVVITSQRPIENMQKHTLMLNILDNQWSFKYEKNQAMYFNQADFDGLTSFLDFYALLIIGFDMDSYYPNGGTDYFNKASDLAVRGASSQFSEGWQSTSATYNRRILMDNLRNAKYQQFRQDYFDYHYNGIDLFNNPQTRKEALTNIAKLVLNLNKSKDAIDPRSVLMKVFFDAKSGELADYLKSYWDKSIFEILKKIDPPHLSKYEEALKDSGAIE